jgi:hypothetical protein
MSGRVKNNFDNQVDSYLSFLKNEYVAAALSLFLILYAGVIAPKLSPNVLSLFDNWIVQIAMFFAIVYISKQNASVALIAAVAVLVTLMVANSKITVKLPQMSSEQFCPTGYRYNVDLLPPHDGSIHGLRIDTNEITNDTTENPSYYRDRITGTIKRDVDGIMDESIEEVDRSMAGFRNAVKEGATTSKGGPKIGRSRSRDSKFGYPKMHSLHEPNYPTHLNYNNNQEFEQELNHQELDLNQDLNQHESNQHELNQHELNQHELNQHESNQHEGQEKLMEETRQVIGIVQGDMDDDSVGSSLDESEHVGSLTNTNANANANDNSGFLMSTPESAVEVVKSTVEKVTSEVESSVGATVPSKTQEEVLSEVKQKMSDLADQGKIVSGYDVVKICREVYKKKF